MILSNALKHGNSRLSCIPFLLACQPKKTVPSFAMPQLVHCQPNALPPPRQYLLPCIAQSPQRERRSPHTHIHTLINSVFDFRLPYRRLGRQGDGLLLQRENSGLLLRQARLLAPKCTFRVELDNQRQEKGPSFERTGRLRKYVSHYN
jgi:hypothetical protein